MNNSAIGKSWDEVRAELFTPQELKEMESRVKFMHDLAVARKKKGLSQRDLEKLSGVSQPVIARMEKGDVNTKIDTIMKILIALGGELTISF